MEDEKKLNEMTIDELVDLILEEPNRMNEIFRSTDDLQALYDALEDELIPDRIVFDDAEMNHNLTIKEALKTLSTDFLYDEPEYEDEEQPVITLEDLIEADRELEEFYAEHPEMDNRPDSQIPEGMSMEEYSEAMDVHIDEFEEIIRPQKSIEQDEELMAWLNGSKMSPLKTREEQLSKLEKEAKTISEAEALIDKQTEKEGQDIGE